MFEKKNSANFCIIFFSIFLFIGAYFRFTFLGYSDLQGDETKVFAYRNVESLWQFLLQNSKGPGQYLVAAITESFYSANIDAEFLYRLPFALAGFFSIYLFYFIAKKYFDQKVALNVLLIAALNGFFIAFSRIVQYQAFEILFALTSTLFFLKFLKDNKESSIFFASFFGVAGFLFHFDAISFIIPQFILLYLTKGKAKNYGIYIGGLLLALIFYLPYVFHENFSSTLNYILKDRAIAEFSYDAVFYSQKLSTIYFSKEYLLIVFLAGAFSFWNLRKGGYYKSLLMMMAFTILARYWVGHPYKPLFFLSVILSLLIFLSVFLDKQIQITKKYFFVWFVVAFTIYILILNKPLTHIYNVYIPLTFLAGYQINKIKSKIIRYSVLFILFVSAVSFNYQAYIENKVEYPWQAEKYIFGKMYQGVSEGEIVRGIFGFPYYRGLDSLNINLLSVVDGNTTPVFYTNIKSPRPSFYLDYDYQQGKPQSIYYIEVKNDRDYEGEPAAIQNVPKTKVFENENYSIYRIESVN